MTNFLAEGNHRSRSVTWRVLVGFALSVGLAVAAPVSRPAAADVGVITVYPTDEVSPPDTEPPNIPQNLRWTTVDHDQVDLRWDGAGDNVGVVEYDLYRDGVELATVDLSAGLRYSDNTVSPNTTYSYTVEAVDAAGNQSGQSPPILVTTP